jgi:hypothetical protein
MRTFIYFGILPLIILTSGCTGTIVTKNLTKAEVSQTGAEFNGVITYPQHWVYEISKTTIRKNKEGNVIAWEVETDPSIRCMPIAQQKLVTKADYDHPMLISYDNGVLEAYKFNVTLTGEGSLQSAGSEASPDRGQTLSNLTSASLNGAKIAGGVPLDLSQIPPCNDGSVIIDHKPYDGKI